MSQRRQIVSTVDIGRSHESLVLRAVLSHGPTGRATLADLTELGRSTVTRVASRLIAEGLLREAAPRSNGAGRPSIPLELVADRFTVATVHFDSAEVRTGLVDPLGRVLFERRVPYERSTPEAAVRQAARDLERLLADVRGERTVLGVGAAIGGWVDPDAGEVIRYAPLQWHREPLAKMLRDELKRPLRFDHDVRASAVAERMFGVMHDVDDFLALWVGDVLGAAVVDGGRIRTGPRGEAGVVAHTPLRNGPGRRCACGRVDCLQVLASERAVVEFARERGLAGDMIRLVRAAQAGDPGAAELVAEAADHLGRGFAAAADLFAPSKVLVSGLITEAPQFIGAFGQALHEEMDRFQPGQNRVAASEFGDLAPTIAAASLMYDDFYEDPLGVLRAARA